jgi:hypothetical protein
MNEFIYMPIIADTMILNKHQLYLLRQTERNAIETILYDELYDNDTVKMIMDYKDHMEFIQRFDYLILKPIKLDALVKITIELYNWHSHKCYIANYWMSEDRAFRYLNCLFRDQTNRNTYYEYKAYAKPLRQIQLDLDCCSYPNLYGNYILTYESIHDDLSIMPDVGGLFFPNSYFGFDFFSGCINKEALNRHGLDASSYTCIFDDINHIPDDKTINDFFKSHLKCPFYIKGEFMEPSFIITKNASKIHLN